MYSFLKAVVGISNRGVVIVMGTLPANAVVLTPYLSCPVAFNSAGANDAFKIGHDTDDDAFGLSKSVTSIITLDNFSNGAEVGYRSSGKKVLLSYTGTGTAPTTGKAIVILPFILVPSLRL